MFGAQFAMQSPSESFYIHQATKMTDSFADGQPQTEQAIQMSSWTNDLNNNCVNPTELKMEIAEKISKMNISSLSKLNRKLSAILVDNIQSPTSNRSSFQRSRRTASENNLFKFKGIGELADTQISPFHKLNMNSNVKSNTIDENNQTNIMNQNNFKYECSKNNNLMNIAVSDAYLKDDQLNITR